MPFFGTRRATPSRRTGRSGSLPSGPSVRCGAGKRLGVEPVIGEHHLGIRRQRAQVRSAGRGAGGGPGAVAQLLALLPRGRGPDVLGVRRDAPRQAAQRCGIARDRGRRVQIVRVQQADVGAAARRENEGLAEAAAAIAGRVAAQIAQPQAPRCPVGRPAPHASPGAQHARGLLVQVLRQIEHGRLRSGGACRAPRGSVGWRSETIVSASPRRSRPRISCAMKVSDRRG